MKKIKKSLSITFSISLLAGALSGCSLIGNVYSANQEEELQTGIVEYEEAVSERELFIKTLQDVSAIELKADLLERVHQLATEKRIDVLEGLSVFEVFQMYMYTQAKLDYATLYYFYPADLMDISEEQFVLEANIEPTNNNTLEFIERLKGVHQFDVYERDGEAAVSFIFPGEEYGYAFSMEKRGATWLVRPLPLQ